MMRVFLAWKRRYADVRAGTQAPPLRILLERVARGCPPLRKIAPLREHLLPSLCRGGTFIWRGKGGFHFYLYLCKQ